MCFKPASNMKKAYFYLKEVFICHFCAFLQPVELPFHIQFWASTFRPFLQVMHVRDIRKLFYFISRIVEWEPFLFPFFPILSIIFVRNGPTSFCQVSQLLAVRHVRYAILNLVFHECCHQKRVALLKNSELMQTLVEPGND